MKTQNYKIVFNKYKVIFLRGSGGGIKKEKEPLPKQRFLQGVGEFGG